MDKRKASIRKMFAEIAPSYDKANTLLSLGMHHLWKNKLLKLSPLEEGEAVLDCATGTGDIAIDLKKKLGSTSKVVGVDFCPEMLDRAQMKAKKKNLDIHFQLADMGEMPFLSKEFQVSTLSFGLRNAENPDKVLKEIARVTQYYVMILEFGQIEALGLRGIYNFYSQKILPLMGGFISGQPQAYQYLNDSSQVFPCGSALCSQIMDTGLYKKVDFWPLSWGVAYIYKCALG